MTIASWSSSPTIIPGGNIRGDVSITALAEGGFALAFTEVAPVGASNLVGRIVAGDGALGTTNILAGASNDVRPLFAPDLVQLDDGTLIATYSLAFTIADTDIISARLSGPGYAQTELATVSDSFLNDTTVYDTAATADGGSVVMYQRDGGTILLQRVLAGGLPLGTPIDVGDSGPLREFDGDLTVLPGGNIVAVWRSFNTELIITQTNMRVFSEDGEPITPEIGFNFGPNPAFPQVIALRNNTYVALVQDVTFGAVTFQIFASNGAAVSGLGFAFGDFSILPKVTALDDGGFIIGWSDFGSGADREGDGSADGRIVLQRYSATGIKIGDKFIIDAPGDEILQDLTTLSDGRVVVAYTRETDDSTDDNRIAYDIVDPRESVLFGTSGADEIYARREDTVIFGQQGNDELFGLDGDDMLDGGGGRDSMTGGGGDDDLLGRSGADTLDGGGGQDSLSGGSGADVIRGGLDADLLRGGGGADQFDFNATGDSAAAVGARDRIFDFVEGLDLIDLQTIDARASTPVSDDFTFIGNAAFNTEGQVRVVRVNGNTEIQVNTSGASVAEMVIVLDGPHTLSASDFLL